MINDADTVLLFICGVHQSLNFTSAFALILVVLSFALIVHNNET